MNDAIRMQISAYVDGELSDSEMELLLRRMSQDADLRREAAEFLELGRAMRGEGSAPGIDRLRERIAAGIDGRTEQDDELSPDTQRGSALRPLVGVAVAASVALIALFGLQLTPGVDGAARVDDAVVEVAEEAGYTVPERIDPQLRRYWLSHGASSGANSVNARLVTLRLSEELLVEEEDLEDAADETAADEPTQP